METVGKIEIKKPGLKLHDYGNDNDRALLPGEVLSIDPNFSHTIIYGRTSLSVRTSSDENGLRLKYIAPLDRSLSPNIPEYIPEAQEEYSIGYSPEVTTAEFGNPEALVRVSYLGHGLRNVVEPLFNPNFTSHVGYRNKYDSAHIIQPIGPMIYSERICLDAYSRNPETFMGEARYFVDFGPLNSEENSPVGSVSVGFVTKDFEDGLLRIIRQDVVDHNRGYMGMVVRQSDLYGRKLAEMGAFFSVIEAFPNLYTNTESHRSNFASLSLIFDYLIPKSHPFDLDADFSQIRRVVGIDWNQILAKMPNIDEDSEKLSTLIKNTQFPAR